uniref:Uncharacterized protein n=1 Tax=Fagus sylvatica TaxID=28930 RepID=A0A2N9GNB0_FAGSY
MKTLGDDACGKSKVDDVVPVPFNPRVRRGDVKVLGDKNLLDNKKPPFYMFQDLSKLPEGVHVRNEEFGRSITLSEPFSTISRNSESRILHREKLRQHRENLGLKHYWEKLQLKNRRKVQLENTANEL